MPARSDPVDVAFITVNYNTLECVTRLSDFFGTLEVPFTFSFTVVDNDSEDGSQEFLKSHPAIRYLQTGENIGYGRAINRGVAATVSKYVCVTNTDVILNREALTKLWEFMESNGSADVCAPRIVYEDGRDQGMVFKPYLFSHYALWFSKLVSRYTKSLIQRAESPVRVDGVMGAFFLIRKSAMPQPALFDEDFFFFYEDTALAHTLKNRGRACFVIPDTTIIHIGGKSRSESSIKFFYGNKYLYLKKFYGPFHAAMIYRLDRARIFRKWMMYELFSSLSDSERIRSKRSHYKTAWEVARRVP